MDPRPRVPRVVARAEREGVGVSAVSGVARVRARGRGRAREGVEAAVGGEGRREVVDGAEPAVASARGPVLLHGKLRAFFLFGTNGSFRSPRVPFARVLARPVSDDARRPLPLPAMNDTTEQSPDRRETPRGDG
eukprot:31067-Pelagococcus_subviridis.AAC.8